MRAKIPPTFTLINNNKKYYVTNVCLKFLLTSSLYLENSFCKKKTKGKKEINVPLLYLIGTACQSELTT